MRQSGFTLIEIIIVIAIITSLYFVTSVPYTKIYKKNQLDTIIYELKNAIYTAKLTAKHSNKTIYLTSLDNDWSNGAKLFSLNSEKDENLIRIWQWSNFKIKISWQGFQPFLIFQTQNNKNTLNGFFLLEHEDQKYKLILNRLGRVRELALS